MVTVTGRNEVRHFIRDLGAGLKEKFGLGAARAGANVIAIEAQRLSISHEVSASIRVRTEIKGDEAIGYIETVGPGAFMAPWLEYGTSPHWISVDASLRKGKSVRTINRRDKDARRSGKIQEHQSLIINGNFVGPTVWHPGARPHPFMNPALDLAGAEAFAAAQKYLDRRGLQVVDGGQE